MLALIPIIFAFLTPQASATITVDYNCTHYNGSEFVYSPNAVACSNTLSDTACQALYTATEYPSVGSNVARALACYSTSTTTATSISQDLKSAAISTCAKTCGYCCQSSAYDCSNAAYPRLDCSTITTSQCNSVIWRTIIAEDCPASCGFCHDSGCVDAIVDCAVDTSICTTIGMQDFVNTYCQRTCGRCASSSSSSSTTASSSSSSCTSYNGDSSAHCAAWAKNGYCTNTFYTTAQRKAYCATTCKIC